MSKLTAEKALTVLRAPLVTEKTSRLADSDNVIAFEVARDANKAQIRRARQCYGEATDSGAGDQRRNGYP